MILTQAEQEVLDKSMARLKLTGRTKVPKDIFYRAVGIDPVESAFRVDERLRREAEGLILPRPN